jgi:two-component system, OmpR family, alkaline phosphatase synthesis response regulator PhoP
MKARILLIEDEAGLVMTLRDRLTSEGHEVEVARDAESGLQRATSEHFNLIILDVMLPGGSGFDVCRDLRQRGITVPIIMLTARGQLIDKVLGLKIGADDYVTKPFGAMELVARVDALARRPRLAKSRAAGAPVDRFGEVEVHRASRIVERAGAPVALSPKEYDLLLALMNRRGAVTTRHELLSEVWGYQSDVSTRTVDIHVSELRKKLEKNPAEPRHILTVRKTGYRFEP